MANMRIEEMGEQKNKKEPKKIKKKKKKRKKKKKGNKTLVEKARCICCKIMYDLE
jgi:hypothetical protein